MEVGAAAHALPLAIPRVKLPRGQTARLRANIDWILETLVGLLVFFGLVPSYPLNLLAQTESLGRCEFCDCWVRVFL
jgi:hypothetical protein